jgi:hypothetical protein
MEHAQRTEKYIRLIFNSYISNNDFFSKVHVHYRHELVFSWRFSRPRGGAHYATVITVYSIVINQNLLGFFCLVFLYMYHFIIFHKFVECSWWMTFIMWSIYLGEAVLVFLMNDIHYVIYFRGSSTSGQDYMLVWFTSTYVIDTYNH